MGMTWVLMWREWAWSILA